MNRKAFCNIEENNIYSKPIPIHSNIIWKDFHQNGAIVPVKDFPFSKQSYVDILLIGYFNTIVNNSFILDLSINLIRKYFSKVLLRTLCLMDKCN